jgi:hypothetical protein
MVLREGSQADGTRTVSRDAQKDEEILQACFELTSNWQMELKEMRTTRPVNTSKMMIDTIGRLTVLVGDNGSS